MGHLLHIEEFFTKMRIVTHQTAQIFFTKSFEVLSAAITSRIIISLNQPDNLSVAIPPKRSGRISLEWLPTHN